MRDGAVDDRVVVGERDGTVAGAPDGERDVTQSGTQRGVVIGPGVPPDTGVGRVGAHGRLVVGQVGTGGDDDRRRVFDRP